MLIAGLTTIVIILVFTVALCKASAKSDKWEEKWIKEREKEEYNR
ncbi:hypothetical protein SAMN05428976_11333 [Clostridium sp. USBA 49]|nr:hypothetical protein [Clostridium sp. USBA 49]SKA89580.1 hypothetical protein SAMN05428976_11333 [Clostridium sp. USBA 49]